MISQIIKNNKIIGNIDKERGMYVSDRSSIHIFKKFGNGFGLSVGILDLLESHGIKKIMIRFENKYEFFTTTDAFLVHGISWNDLGDEQLILPFEYFNRKNVEERQVAL